MSADALVFWLFVAAWVVVVGLLLFVTLPSGVREARRIVTRILALTDSSALAQRVAEAERDVDRIEAALNRIPVLQDRAAVALTVIRTTPLVPVAITGLRARIVREIRAFRREWRF